MHEVRLPRASEAVLRQRRGGSGMKPSEIRKGAVYLNFDLEELRKVVAIEAPAGIRSCTLRQMRVQFQWISGATGWVSLGTFARWATREATHAEAAEHFPNPVAEPAPLLVE